MQNNNGDAIFASFLPASWSSSSCSTETSQGTHSFGVHEYSRLKLYTSPAFDVGGFSWAVHVYPSGICSPLNSGDRMLLLLVATRPFDAQLKIKWKMHIFNHVTRMWHTLLRDYGITTVVAPKCQLRNAIIAGNQAPVGIWIYKSMIEAPCSPYLRNNGFDIRCDLTVIRLPRPVSKMAKLSLRQITRAPSRGSLASDLVGLPQKSADTDMTFHVQGESFAAHRAVVAARSPVFMAELLRQPTKEKITGQDVQSYIFRIFLYFIYTDALPADILEDDLDGGDIIEMLRHHLLIAADRYDVRGLKQLCENLLCDQLNTRTVRDTLTLAKQYHCGMLKEACEELLKDIDETEEKTED